MSTDTSGEVPTNHIEAYGAYPFSSDETYQVGILFTILKRLGGFSNHFISPRKQGLASILAANSNSTNSSPEVREELELERRTRVFYFNRLGLSSINFFP